MILVTGGTGFVGSHLLYQLAKNNSGIRAIYRSKTKLEKVIQVFSLYDENAEFLFNKIEWVEADITDVTSLEKSFENITHVYHCAAIVTFNPKKYQQMRKVNIEGTANIVNFCIAHKIKKLCHVSTIATLGNAINGNAISEKNEWNNDMNNGYAITKHGAEMEVWRASQEGVAIVMVNPGVILGSGFFNEGSGKIFTKINKGFNFYTEGVTGFVGVKDVVSSMIILMNSSTKDERFIVVAENCTFKDIFFQIADNLSVKRPSIKANKFWLEFGWRVEKIYTMLVNREALITKISAKASYNKEYFSAQKLINTIGYSFTPISKVIVETCKDFRFKD